MEVKSRTTEKRFKSRKTVIMKSRINKTQVIIELELEEALVLQDWLYRFNEADQTNHFEDQAEERVLWDLESSIENLLSDTFKEDYKTKLDLARKKIRDYYNIKR